MAAKRKVKEQQCPMGIYEHLIDLADQANAIDDIDNGVCIIDWTIRAGRFSFSRITAPVYVERSR